MAPAANSQSRRTSRMAPPALPSRRAVDGAARAPVIGDPATSPGGLDEGAGRGRGRARACAVLGAGRLAPGRGGAVRAGQCRDRRGGALRAGQGRRHRGPGGTGAGRGRGPGRGRARGAPGAGAGRRAAGGRDQGVRAKCRSRPARRLQGVHQGVLRPARHPDRGLAQLRAGRAGGCPRACPGSRCPDRGQGGRARRRQGGRGRRHRRGGAGRRSRTARVPW